MQFLFTLKKAFLFFCFILASSFIYAADFNCALTGTNSGNWNAAGTWTRTSGTDADGIPDADDNVFISQGRVIATTTSEVNNIEVISDNAIHLTINNTIILRIFGKLESSNASTSYTGAAPIQGGGGIIEFPATSTRTAISSFYGNTYTFGIGNVPSVNLGTTTASTHILTIGGFQAFVVNVKNCFVNSVDHFYVRGGDATIESTGTFYQDINAGVTFGFQDANRNTNGINNFNINGVFRTGSNVAATAIIVGATGTFVVSSAANRAGLRSNSYTIDGTLEYNTGATTYTAGSELTDIVTRSLGSLKLTGGTVVLPDLIFDQTWTLNNSLIVGNGKLNLFEHTLNLANTATNTRTGTGYVITETAGTNAPKLTAALTTTRTFFEFHVGTTTAYTPIIVTTLNNTNLPTTISASMYTAYSACGTSNADLTKSVNLNYNVTSSVAAQALSVDFNYATSAANTLRGTSYIPANAKILGCTGSAYAVLPGAVNIGEYPSATVYGTYYGRAWFGGNNTPLDGRRIMISSDNAFIGNPPGISAVSTSGITATAASVNYTVNANGNNASTQLKYGTSSNNLNLTQTGTTATGSINTPLSVTLTGLTASTQYFYSVEATNSVGNATAVSGNFTTTAASNVPTISNVAAGSIAENSFVVGYTINANGSSTTPIVRYGTVLNNLNQSVIGSVISGTTNTNAQVNITGLTGGTQYFYRVDASNASGNATPSSTNNVTTLSLPVAPTSGLIAYYGFSNNTNSHNNSHNLTANATTYVTGKVGNGVSFTSAADRALSNATLSGALPSNGPFTICFWQNTTSNISNFPTYFEMFGSCYVRSQFSQDNYTRLRTGYAYSNSVITTPQFEDRAYNNYSPNGSVGWNHFAFVHNPNTTNLMFYLNGTYIGEVNQLADRFIHKFNTVFAIGGGTDGAGVLQTNKRFDGIIDEFYVYNRVLTPTEITTVKDDQAGVLLPLILTKFSGSLTSSKAQLNWQTSSEINTSNFEVEYSVNGTSFMKIASVLASGNSNDTKAYSATHSIGNASIHYYRLKMIDKDGKSTYSSTIKLAGKNGLLQIVAIPSISKGVYAVSITNNTNEVATLQVVNTNGQVVSKQSIQTVNGIMNMPVNITEQPNNIYFLQVITSKGMQVQKIVKQ